MDSKIRFLAALNNQKPDRVPFNFWMDRRLMEQYEKRLGHRHWRVTHFGADVIETFGLLEFPTGRMEEHTGTTWLEEPLFTDWSTIDDLPMPDPDEEKVYELVKKDLAEFPDKAVIFDIPTCWGIIAGQMRGYEEVYMDLYTHTEAFVKLSRRITDIQKRMVERVCQLGITALYVMEDVSTTNGLSMSPEMIEEHCFRYARELISIADRYGIPTLFHCCGKIPSVLAEMFIKLGIKAINPLQPSVNDTAQFAVKYSGKLAVYGALENSFIIPQGTPAQIREHVLTQFELLGKPHGGLIFSSHDIDIRTPPENIEAMVSTIKECVYQ